MAAPTFVGSSVAAFSSTTNPHSADTSLTISTGDILAAAAGTENDFQTTSNFTFAGGPTYTEQTISDYTPGDGSQCVTQTATAAPSSGTFTGSIDTNESGLFGAVFAQFSGSDGIGASAQGNNAIGSGAPSISITTTQDNSALLAIFCDWNAGSGTSRTWNTINSITPTSANGYELTYYRNAAAYTVYVAYWPDAGTAGSKTVGMSVPSNMQWVGSVVEIKGAASSGNATVTPSAVAAIAALPAVSISAPSNATVTPTAIAAVAAVGAPTITAVTAVSPATIAALAAVPATTESTGTSVSPAVTAAVAGVGSPTVATQSNATVAAATVAAVSAVQAPTVDTSTGATVAVATIAAVAAVPATTETTGSTVAASTVATTAAVPSPTVSTGTNALVTPAAIAAVAAVGPHNARHSGAYPMFFDFTKVSFQVDNALTADSALQIASGDLVIGAATSKGGASAPDFTFGPGTWTEETLSRTTATGEATAQIAQQSPTAGSLTPTIAQGTVDYLHGSWAQFRETLGTGAFASGAPATVSAPSISITTEHDNSAIFVVIQDGGIVDGTSRIWRTVNGFTPSASNGYELYHAAANTYVAYYPDAGTAGTKTVGLTQPNLAWAGQAIEVRGPYQAETVLAAAVAALAAVPAPTVSTGTSLTAATVSAVAAVPTPTVVAASNATVAVATIAATTAVPAVSVSAPRNATPAVSAVAAVAAVGSPTVTTTNSATVAVSTIATTAAVPAPTVAAATNTTVAVSTVAAVAAVPSVTTLRLLTVSPATVSAVAAVPSPTTTTGSSVSASTIQATASVLDPTLSISNTVYYFSPPTRLDHYRPHEEWRLGIRIPYNTGTTVLKQDGFYATYSTESISDEQIAAADVAYLGGHEYRLTDAERADLIAAGYGSYILSRLE